MNSSFQDVLRGIQPHDNYKLDALGHAELFAEIFKDSLRYNATSKTWLSYDPDSGLWCNDIGDVRVMEALLKMLAELTQFCATAMDNPAQMGAYLEALASTYRRLNIREAILRDAQRMLSVTASDLDQHDELLCLKNGVIDLRSLEFKKHSPEYLFTKSANAVYDETATCPRWVQFIDEVMSGDKGKANYLQRLFGYCLTADTSLEQLYILHGSTTRNGKSTLMEVLTHAFGAYAVTSSSATFELQKSDDTRRASGDLARLAGCRLVHASEPQKRMIFDTARLKTLTGGDRITARHLHEREFEFSPKFKLVINTNFLPLITDNTLFSSGRVVVIPFDRHFDESEQDRTLKQTLKRPENLSGILNWALDGLRMFRRDGLFQPDAIRAATANYESKSDKIQNFIEICLEKDDGCNEKMTDCYKVFKVWCLENGYGVENHGNFVDDMKNKGLWAKSATVRGLTYRNVVRCCRISSDYWGKIAKIA